jgi:hypothetical protein
VCIGMFLLGCVISYFSARRTLLRVDRNGSRRAHGKRRTRMKLERLSETFNQTAKHRGSRVAVSVAFVGGDEGTRTEAANGDLLFGASFRTL